MLARRTFCTYATAAGAPGAGKDPPQNGFDCAACNLDYGGIRARSSMDRASDYGSEGWGFESLRARWVRPRSQALSGACSRFQERPSTLRPFAAVAPANASSLDTFAGAKA